MLECVRWMSAVEAAYLNPSAKTVVISILDQFEESSRPKRLSEFRDHLSLSFVDTFERTKATIWPDEMTPAEHLQACRGIEGDRAPVLSDAVAIVKFVRKHHESAEALDLVVHCYAGRSRSVAVARWVSEFLNLPIQGLDEERRRLLDQANKRVLRLLRIAARGTANPAGHPWHDALSLELHQAAVNRILAEPEYLARASETLDRWIAMDPDSRSMPYFVAWREIIRTHDWETALAETDAGQALRSSSPLVFVLSRPEIEAIRETALARRSFERKRSQQLQLSFPYDWSNPAISDDALIHNVLEQGILVDICRICAHFGIERVEAVGASVPEVTEYWLAQRMMRNIKRGFALAERDSGQDNQAQPASVQLSESDEAVFVNLALQIHRRTRRQDVIDLMGFMKRGKTLDEIYDAALAVDASCTPAAADCVLLGLASFDQVEATEPGDDEMRQAYEYFAAAIDDREVSIAALIHAQLTSTVAAPSDR